MQNLREKVYIKHLAQFLSVFHVDSTVMLFFKIENSVRSTEVGGLQEDVPKGDAFCNT